MVLKSVVGIGNFERSLTSQTLDSSEQLLSHHK